MEVKQIYEFVNQATSTALGETGLVKEDLSNVVDVGEKVFNANAVDAYARALVNQVGKFIFVNRPYRGSVPSVLMDGWEYGSVLEKVQMNLPDATENESWDLGLEDNQSYDPNVFYKPDVSVKFFNKRVTFEIPMSFTEKQLRQSFTSAEQMNGFISMVYNAVDRSMTVKLDSLVMRCITNGQAETIYADYAGEDVTTKSGVKAINLLHLFKQVNTGSSVTASTAMTDPEFIRFATYNISLIRNRMTRMSTLFNVGKSERFTPDDLLHVVFLQDFKSAADVFLQSGTFNADYTALPNAETVPYWQASGTGYAYEDVSRINVKTATGHDVDVTGVIGVMFDRDALGVTNMDRRVTTNYNPKAEFYSNWFKYDAGYFNDLNENFVVFFVQ